MEPVIGTNITDIYYATLLCELMKVVSTDNGLERSQKAESVLRSDLVYIAETGKCDSLSDFLNKFKDSDDQTEENVQSLMSVADQRAKEATEAVRCIIDDKMEVITKWTNVRSAAVGGLAIILVGGIVVLSSVATGGVIATAATTATVFTEAGLGAAIASAVGCGAAGLALAVKEIKYEQEQYDEKLKFLLTIFDLEKPVPQVTEDLEDALVKGLDSLDFNCPLKTNGYILHKDSVKLYLANTFVKLIDIKRSAMKKTVIMLVGRKNVGKSTGAESIFGVHASAGAAHSTLIPTPYDFFLRGKNALVVDFPGTTDVRDEPHKLATKYLRLGGAGAWCLVFINPFQIDMSDSKLMNDLVPYFSDRNRILVVCTHGDAKDHNGDWQVSKFGGVANLHKYVVDTISREPFKVSVPEGNVFIGSFIQDENGIPGGVLGPDRLKRAVHDRIYQSLMSTELSSHRRSPPRPRDATASSSS